MERNSVDGKGLLGKTPAEMNTFPSNPAEYEHAVRNVEDARAENSLERVHKMP